MEYDVTELERAQQLLIVTSLLRFADSKVPQEEVDALQEITAAMGVTHWKFDGESCEVKMVGVTLVPPKNAEHDISCECETNSDVCHVVRIVLKGYNLPGTLPPQLVKLPYLREIDFAYNYLHGTIPTEWASMKLTSMCLEANQFSGAVPPEIGNLVNLKTLILSSNQLTGYLPVSLGLLRNLSDLINDNNFNGSIPSFVQKWEQLSRLEMQSSGLEGPIPTTVSLLNNLVDLRISDFNGPIQGFPTVRNMTGIVRLVLRNCNISGEIPAYIWTMKDLEMLDVSFNKLVGKIPASISANRLRFIFLSGNMLSGDVPDSILRQGASIDLSYNNFTWQGPEKPVCQENMWGALSCKKDFTCPQYSNCLHVNCGGKDTRIKENQINLLYEGDGDVEGGAAKYFIRDDAYWGFSSTGDFMDDNDFQNTRYTVSRPLNISELYRTARIAPISLTYFHYCLENGNYTITFNFAEIEFTNDETYSSLGRRIFDIYVQENLLWKDFNIESEARSAQKPLIKQVYNVSVTNNFLEIRFYWAGRGTTRIPERSVYGPLVSAISVVSDFKQCPNGRNSGTAYMVLGVVGSCLLFFILGVLGILWWKGCLLGKCWRKEGTDIKGDMPSGTFTLKQIKVATDDFDPANKIGEGGFGPVYKGQLPDGTKIAVKQLSSKSRQGNREFLNEIGMISCLQHPNLVKLHGFCVEGDQLLLVYEYMENNSLARALFGPEHNRLELDWATRLKICIGIARGLAFLHEESRLKIVHRDIKATNVLLDSDLNPKISDFGLARLDEEEKTHITTRIAGTIGYMAPEYALWGHLTYKADVYSFGVVACHLHQAGNLVALLNERLRSEVKKEELELMVKVALLCTNVSASLRPTMSEVVSMLEGKMTVPDMIPEPGTYTEDLRFKAMRDLCRQKEDQSSSGSQTQTSTVHNFSSSTWLVASKSITHLVAYQRDSKAKLRESMGGVANGVSTMKLLGCLILTVLMLVCMEPNYKVEAQVEPPSPPDNEAQALHEIAAELGKKDWNFSENPCNNKSSWFTPPPLPNMPKAINNSTVTCNCSFPNGECHIDGIYLTGQDLDGVLPRSLVKLPYIKTIQLYLNYLKGTIPREWTALKLEFLSVSMNHLSGPIPSYLGNMTSLKYLTLENNLFSGTIPPELGNLVNLENLTLNANFLTGEIPFTLTKLSNIKELRISGNNFTGKIPNSFHRWKQLEKLEIQASGLEGPIPSSLSVLHNLTELRISDLPGEGSKFPNLENMKNMYRLMLRSCNISGQIPDYLWEFSKMQILDLSFNKLEGNILDSESLTKTQYMYLTSNSLTGPIPEWINARDSRFQIDLSYNNFSESSEPASCRENLNLFKSFSGSKNSGQDDCLKHFPCSKDWYSVYINCGGGATTINGINYEADEDAGGPAKYFPLKETWETSSTGLFWDTSVTSKDYIAQNVSILKINNSELYTRARLSPLSLTYYFRCLANGSYTVTLHFAEIVIRDNRSFHSLGRRIFDVYVQEKLVLKDFNIKSEAKGVDKAVIRTFKTSVGNKTLTIRFHWAGKGTTATPRRGTYGPLISAISVDSDFKPPAPHVANTKMKFLVGAVVSVPCLILIILGILWWKGYFRREMSREQVLRGLDLQTGFFTYRQMKAATNNFDAANKIGEGGFGSVYKGELLDGTIIAIKKLSSKSKQGDREFLNELGMISGLQHPNLVRLYGCCVEGTQLLLVYEYMENNSLSRALFGPKESQLHLDWPTRQNICLGIAKGLAFLHEESSLKIVHRDIKTTNVLLDKDLNAKISDFGLAKFDEEENTHISTRIAGTIGYMAPEYALWGYLTFKADVYSFGIVALEIVAGKNNTKYRPEEDYVCLQDWALVLQQKGNLMELVDPRLGTEYNEEEAMRMIKVALLCTNSSPALRPVMSEIVNMLEGRIHVPELIMDPSIFRDDSRFGALRDQLNQMQSGKGRETNTFSTQTSESSSTSTARLDSQSINRYQYSDSGPWMIVPKRKHKSRGRSRRRRSKGRNDSAGTARNRSVSQRKGKEIQVWRQKGTGSNFEQNSEGGNFGDRFLCLGPSHNVGPSGTKDDLAQSPLDLENVSEGPLLDDGYLGLLKDPIDVFVSNDLGLRVSSPVSAIEIVPSLKHLTSTLAHTQVDSVEAEDAERTPEATRNLVETDANVGSKQVIAVESQLAISPFDRSKSLSDVNLDHSDDINESLRSCGGRVQEVNAAVDSQDIASPFPDAGRNYVIESETRNLTETTNQALHTDFIEVSTTGSQGSADSSLRDSNDSGKLTVCNSGRGVGNGNVRLRKILRKARKKNIQAPAAVSTRALRRAIFAGEIQLAKIITEPRISGLRGESVRNSLGFDGVEFVDPIGFSGGIWVLWDSREFDATMRSRTQQEITMDFKVRSSNFIFAVSAVYANPDHDSRALLWDYLSLLNSNLNHPWLWIGDFNEPLRSSDKFGGRSINIARSALLNDCINSCGMIDVGFVGPKFTWSNSQPLNTLIQERIDRAWVNHSWLDVFPNSIVFHLVKTCSDHCPFLFATEVKNPVLLDKPFRFQPMWLFEPSFFDVVKRTWDAHPFCFDAAVLEFTFLIKDWNKTVFGNVFHNKKRIQARLLGIQKEISVKPSHFLLDLDRELRLELANLIRKEETLWAMKSRIDWLLEGDNNTSFFHKSTIVRRRFNRIVALKDDNNNWLYDENCKNHVVEFFKSLYSTEVSSCCLVPYDAPPGIRKVSAESLDRLVCIPFCDDIKDALWSLKPFKAPGPDGLHAGFFQKCWSDVGNNLCVAIKHVFNVRRIFDNWKQFLICLVPKTLSADNIRLFRPISLGNTCYKVVTKILANRLKNCLKELINPVQGAFLPGRRASDNIIIVQEALNSAYYSQAKDGWVCIKIDLEKAFDRLEWGFIREMLFFFGFPEPFIALIISCISNPNLSVLINGTTSESFVASRGIRQGDPISPYLFILSMEYLSLMIENEVNSHNWNPILVGRGGPRISHVLFADDIMLFAKANIANCDAISRTLHEFCIRSGQKVNASKTKLWCSLKVSEDNMNLFINRLGFRKVNNLGVYLGHPTLVAKAKKGDFLPVIDKIRSKLSGWKAHNLSITGRCTLIQSVSSAMADYSMNTSMLPASIHVEIDRLHRNFLWGESDECKKIHLVNWDQVTKKKRRGGLNLRKAKFRNIALLAKLQWRAKKSPEDLWVKAINCKYKAPSSTSNRKHSSDVWKSLGKGDDVLEDGCRKVVKSGLDTSFWFDRWLSNCDSNLRSLISGPLNRNEELLRVADCVDHNGGWDLSLSSFLLPDCILKFIFSTALPFNRNQNDLIVWNFSSDGSFNLNSAYEIAASIIHEKDDFVFWKKLWHVPCHFRVMHFLWTAALDKLCTRSMLYHRKISFDPCCDLCLDTEESVLHILRDCTIAHSLWDKISHLPQHFFDCDNVFDWFRINLSDPNVVNNLPWPCLFAYCCWSLWYSRNARLFQGKALDFNSVFNTSFVKASEFFHLGAAKTKFVARKIVNVHWIPPSYGWFKLNSDGSTLDNPGLSGSGGCIRNEFGEWMYGYARNIVHATSVHAELWGLRDGLKLALDKGISLLEVSIDAKVVITLIEKANANLHPLGNLIIDCRTLMSQFHRLKLSHCYREGNRLADALANLGRNSGDNFIDF
ncbi:reverse transcriptase [Corchorus capsularis]|uniref:Reverse transcriptase n=1 Tax=Corchorus capsularis TaxID=210143 RepID=A0A1R3IUX4_COCAP|nr:reverse transcriptase [Corchorus capsularis]